MSLVAHNAAEPDPGQVAQPLGQRPPLLDRPYPAPMHADVDLDQHADLSSLTTGRGREQGGRVWVVDRDSDPGLAGELRDE